MIGRLAYVFLTLLGVGFSSMAMAQDTWPSRTVKIIVPFSAGGPPDLSGRVLAEHFQRETKQTFIVENRTGTPGAVAAYSAEPDGYTLAVTSATHIVQKFLNKNFTYDIATDVAPVSPIIRGYQYLVVRKSAPYNTFKEFIDYAKANPGKVTYATAGPSLVAFLFEDLKDSFGLDLLQIPYRGIVEAKIAVIGEQVDLHVDTDPNVKEMVDAKQAKVLVRFAPARLPIFPDVPAVTEFGVKTVQSQFFFGLVAPKGTPQPIVDKLAAMVDTLPQGSKDRVANASAAAWVGGGPAQLRDLIVTEKEAFARIAARAGIKPE